MRYNSRYITQIALQRAWVREIVLSLTHVITRVITYLKSPLYVARDTVLEHAPGCQCNTLRAVEWNGSRLPRTR